MTKPEHKLRCYQYKLSSLFILTTLVACACSWHSVQMEKTAKRRPRSAWRIIATWTLGGRDVRMGCDSSLQRFQAQPKWEIPVERSRPHGPVRIAQAGVRPWR